MDDNDILVYADSGCEINPNGSKRFAEYMNFVRQYGLLAFEHCGCKEYMYTKVDILDYFNLSEKNDFLNSEQLLATIVMIKKTPSTLKMIEEWFNIMHTCTFLIDDSPSSRHEYDGFIENRHGQSIFSILAKFNHAKVLPLDEVRVEDDDWTKMTQQPLWVSKKREYIWDKSLWWQRVFKLRVFLHLI